MLCEKYLSKLKFYFITLYFANNDMKICVMAIMWHRQLMKYFQVILIVLVCSSAFSQETAETLTDKRDGNVYKVITIGTYKWMAENLRFMPDVTPVDEGYTDDMCRYVYGYDGYDVDSAKSSENYAKYGVLYNWSAAKKSCPRGWHLPSEDEWQVLEQALGDVQLGPFLAGESDEWEDGKMKKDSNYGKSEFNALPSGYRDGNGFFAEKGQVAYFWTANKFEVYYAYYRYIAADETYLGHEHGQVENGYSVRCVKLVKSK